MEVNTRVVGAVGLGYFFSNLKTETKSVSKCVHVSPRQAMNLPVEHEGEWGVVWEPSREDPGCPD